MINAWTYSGTMLNRMAAWMKTQMNLTPTYHREYFRKRVDGSLYEEYDNYYEDKNEQNLKTRSPCAQGSRWYEFAFTSDDYAFGEFTVERANGAYLVTMNGVPRTVLDEWQEMIHDGGYVDMRLGNWEFCKSML